MDNKILQNINSQIKFTQVQILTTWKYPHYYFKASNRNID